MMAAAALALMLGVSAAVAQSSGQGPLSAIDWLSESVDIPVQSGWPVSPQEDGSEDAITMRPLDRPRPEAVGLFPASRAGLSATFWGTSTGADLARLVRALPEDALPALRDLQLRLLLAEFAPPAGSDGFTQTMDGAATDAAPDLLLARLEKLYAIGAVDQAGALLDVLEARDPRLRMMRFEIALLLGQETRACADMLAPSLPPVSEAAAIFCLARNGEWLQSEARLIAAEDEGTLDPEYAALLLRFLDAEDDTHEPASSGDPTALARLSPLAWAMLEAVGDYVPSYLLPIAFAHADLRGTIGWRGQIEAAERLVRAGALPPNRLLGLYTERAAAASGGIWERVRAVQALEAALAAGTTQAVGAALVRAWPHFVSGELEVPFALLYSDALAAHALTGAAAETAFLMGMLSPEYEAVALAAQAQNGRESALIALARGMAPPGTSALESALADAFTDPPPLSAQAAALLSDARPGEAVLAALVALSDPGDLRRLLTESLAVLRAVGLEDSARRTALQLMLLERRG
jgi:hypothetical protein